MRLFNFFTKKKLLLLNILLTLYIVANMVGGERGLISYYEKKNKQQNLVEQEQLMSEKLNEFEKKNQLLSTKLNLDYVDMLYRENLKFGKKDEIIINLK
jgi:cell division protein DivIC